MNPERWFIEKVRNEYRRARSLFPKFNSGHEGYAVIKEELEELWDEIKASPDSREITVKMVDECIQVSAMLLAFYMDLSGDESIMS
jgi:hypothetical protein